MGRYLRASSIYKHSLVTTIKHTISVSHVCLDIMSLKTVIAMFVSCMAPLFLVYVVVNGTHMLQIDNVTYIDKTTPNRAHLAFLISVVLCVVLYEVILICATMCGGKTRAEKEHVVSEVTAAYVGQGDKGEVE